MWIAIEAFLDELEDFQPCDNLMVLQRFAEYIRQLGTQPTTITISSLVQDMLAAYSEVDTGTEVFSCAPDVAGFVEHFVMSRECFFHASGRQPAVEATFLHCDFAYLTAELDIQIHYSWAQPLLHFRNLSNTVFEGEHFMLQPSALDSQLRSSRLPYTAEYFVGPAEPWLHWDDNLQCLQGVVPHQRASDAGALRLDAYTIPLEVMAIVTKYFPESIRLERVIRCALPLTIKRRPDRCAPDEEEVTSPPLRSQASQTVLAGDMRARRLGVRRHEEVRLGDISHRSLAPHDKTSRDRSWRLPAAHDRPSLRDYSVLTQNKENVSSPANIKELDDTLKRKAERNVASPPLRMDALSLARLYDSAQHEASTSPISDARSSAPTVRWSSNNPYRIYRVEMRLGQTDERLAAEGSDELPSFQSDL